MNHVSKDNTANILLADIDSSMQIAGSLGRFNINLSEAQILEHTKLLCVCAKWLGEDEMMEIAPEDFSEWDSFESQQKMLTKVWKVLDKADYVIGHNFESFDKKMLNGYFLRYGLSKPSPYKVIDTLKIARQNFRLDSNKLDSIGRLLDIGRKTPHTGADLWIRCHKGHSDSYVQMLNYCSNDVLLLEDVYLKLRHWDSTHPDISFHSKDDGNIKCPICSSSNLTNTGKKARTQSYEFDLLRCDDCGGWHRSRKSNKRMTQTIAGVK